MSRPNARSVLCGPFALSAGLLVGAVSCKQAPQTHLLVRVHAVGFDASNTFDTLRVRVYSVAPGAQAGDGPRSTLLDERQYAGVTPASLAARPFEFALVPGAASRSIGEGFLARVEVYGVLSAREAIGTQLVAGYLSAGPRVVDVDLVASCAGLYRSCLDERPSTEISQAFLRCADRGTGPRCERAYEGADDDAGAVADAARGDVVADGADARELRDSSDSSDASDTSDVRDASGPSFDVVTEVGAAEVSVDAPRDERLAPDAEPIDAAEDRTASDASDVIDVIDASGAPVEAGADVALLDASDASTCPSYDAGAGVLCVPPGRTASCNALAGGVSNSSDRCVAGVDAVAIGPFGSSPSTVLEVWTEAPLVCNTSLRARRIELRGPERALRLLDAPLELSAGLPGAHAAPQITPRAEGAQVTWLYQPSIAAPVQVLSTMIAPTAAAPSAPMVAAMLPVSELPRTARLFVTVLSNADLGAGPREYLVGCVQTNPAAQIRCFSSEKTAMGYVPTASMTPMPGVLLGASLPLQRGSFGAGLTTVGILVAEESTSSSSQPLRLYQWTPRPASTLWDRALLVNGTRALRRELTAAVYAPWHFAMQGCPALSGTTPTLPTTPTWNIVGPINDNASVMLLRVSDLEGGRSSSMLFHNGVNPYPNLASVAVGLGAECQLAVLLANRAGELSLRSVSATLAPVTTTYALESAAPATPLAMAPLLLDPTGFDPMITRPTATSVPQLVLFGAVYPGGDGVARAPFAGLRWSGGMDCH